VRYEQQVHSVEQPIWSREFDKPIPLPDCGELRTLLERAVIAAPRSGTNQGLQAVWKVMFICRFEGREAGEVGTVALTPGLQESKR